MARVKQKLVAGAEIDFLTQAEARQIMREARKDALEGQSTRVRATESGSTDASGNGTVTVYRVPAGRKFRLTRILVEADGQTFGVEFHSATGFVVIKRSGGQIVWGTQLAAASNIGIPFVFNWSASAGMEFLNNETVDVVITGGPVSVGVQVDIEGDLIARVPIEVVT